MVGGGGVGGAQSIHRQDQAGRDQPVEEEHVKSRDNTEAVVRVRAAHLLQGRTLVEVGVVAAEPMT